MYEGELKISEMLTYRNDAQIRAIAQQYQQRFQKPLDAAIRDKFKGHMEDALLLQLARANNRAMSDATLLEDAMKGVGTKDELLIQRVVRLHWNRQYRDEVKRVYQQKYHKDLLKRIEGETSGNYKEVLVNCLK